MGTDSDVIVVGAGPAGLMVAAELGLAGVRTLVLERHARRPDHCRGFNLNARSLELLDRRGLAGRFLAEGPTVPFGFFADPGRPLDLTAMATDHPYTLGIAQTRVEELLEGWVAERGVPVRRDHQVVGLEQDPDTVTVTVRGPAGASRLHARYVVGCDGARSTVRHLAGIGFPGTPSTRYSLLADAELGRPGDLPFGVTRGAGGSVFVIPRPGYARIILTEPDPPPDHDQPVTLAYLQSVLDRVLGWHTPLAAPRWLTRFGNAARQADRYVAGRVVLAGDAAHIHPPAGAVGVNVALADAVNLGWKLAAAVHGWAPASLLASYHSERHAAGERVLRHTKAQELLGGDDPQLAPLRELLAELAALPPVNTYLAELVTGVSTRYDMPPLSGPASGQASPWLGRLAPNLRLTGDGPPTTLAELLHPGRGVLLELDDPAAATAAAAGWAPRVDLHHAHCGQHPDLRALLVRPDGHTAWLSTGTHPQPATTLTAALTTWFGAGRRTPRPGRGAGSGR